MSSAQSETKQDPSVEGQSTQDQASQDVSPEEDQVSPKESQRTFSTQMILFLVLLIGVALSWIFYNVPLPPSWVFTGLKSISEEESQLQKRWMLNLMANDTYYDDMKEIPECDPDIEFAEFHVKFVRESIPCVLPGMSARWPAYEKWTDDYLREKIGAEQVKVDRATGNRVFAYFKKDWSSIPMTFSEFLDIYNKEDREYNYYFAAQNILEQLEDDVIFPRLGELWYQEKVNYWQSQGGTESLPHTDGFENFLCQIDGYKELVLSPPTDRLYITTYEDIPNYSLQDFYDSEQTAEKYPEFKKVRKLYVKLQAGNCLYLPSYWWHHVKSSKERNQAVNFWYMPYSRLQDYIWRVIESHSQSSMSIF